MPRPRTSQLVIDEFAKIIDSQDNKGFEKYGTSIDNAKDEDYDWKLMALEETADLQKYLVREISKREVANEFLLKQLLDKKATIRELKSQSTFHRYEKLEKENLELAEENSKLKEQLQSIISKYESI